MSLSLKRIGMWSSPRCLSTILMRSWENRSDTFVKDEPLYPYFLSQTGRPDPGAEDVLKHYETDWVKVVEQLTTGPVPQGKTIYYQKLLTHHLVGDIQLDWLLKLTNCFLIRPPKDMLLSYTRLWPDPTFELTGLPMLKKLFEWVLEQTGKIPPLIDSRDLQNSPKETLQLLCQAIDVEFDEAALNWSEGGASSEMWSQYKWYDSVKYSTQFKPYHPKSTPVPEHLLTLLKQCDEIYHYLYEYRLH